jgi:hypothetical protein
MASVAKVVSTGLLALFALGCKKNPDPRHIDLGDFNSGKQLSDTLKKLVPPGTRVLLASEVMQINGFTCGERSGITVDVNKGELGSGKPYLECYNSTRIDLGLKRREWTVKFNYDSAGVQDVVAGYIIQP